MALFHQLNSLNIDNLTGDDEFLVRDASIPPNDSAAFKRISLVDLLGLIAQDSDLIRTAFGESLAAVNLDSGSVSLNVSDSNPAILRDSGGVVVFYIDNTDSSVINNFIVQGQVTDLSNHTTDDLNEGLANLYYNDSRVETWIDTYFPKDAIHFRNYVDMETPSNGTFLYMDSIGDGGSSLFVSHEDGTKDELITKNKSILYSLIF